MPTIKKTISKPRKKIVTKKQKNKGFEKAWEFWKDAHVDLTGLAFDREEANAR